MNALYDHGNGIISRRVILVDAAGAPLLTGLIQQYTEGDTDASITGTASMWEDAADTLRVISETYPQPVRQAALTPANDKVSIGAATSGGWTPGKLVSAATTNATVIKASAGQIGYLFCSNVNADERYLKLYNKATTPTVGTDVPVATLIIPGNAAGGGHQITIPGGIEFTTGIAFALTTEATDAGSTGVAASEIVVNYGYK